MASVRELAGIVLAAGAGRRAGGPKALRRDDAGTPWIALAASTLRRAGCGDIVVVLGAEAPRAEPLVPSAVSHVVARDWEDGLSASLRRGLAWAGTTGAVAAVVTLVDLPTMPAAVVSRLLDAGPVVPGALRRVVHRGRPGHPVLLGRAHWDPVARAATGDRGAGPYLREHGALAVECADLWDGADRDR